MNPSYKEIAERIRGEVSDLGTIIERALRSWAKAQRMPEEQDIYLDSVALNLHGFYSGVERLFELIVRHVDRSIPSGKTWHRDMLMQISKEFEDVRPAVINQESALSLDEFRRFRHIVRNVYTLNLVPDKMIGLMSILPELWDNLHKELLAFADFLAELAKVNEPHYQE